MKTGLQRGKEPETGAKGAGVALLKILGIGLAAGVALVAATDKVMKKATSSKVR